MLGLRMMGGSCVSPVSKCKGGYSIDFASEKSADGVRNCTPASEAGEVGEGSSTIKHTTKEENRTCSKTRLSQPLYLCHMRIKL